MCICPSEITASMRIHSEVAVYSYLPVYKRMPLCSKGFHHEKKIYVFTLNERPSTKCKGYHNFFPTLASLAGKALKWRDAYLSKGYEGYTWKYMYLDVHNYKDPISIC